jgi:hypothetical protein
VLCRIRVRNSVALDADSDHSGCRPGAELPTLAKLDDLLSWEPGSAERALHGGDPVPREDGVYGKLPAPPVDAPEEDVAAATAALNDVFDTAFEDPAGWDYNHLLRWIDQRLRELNMTKSKFAAIGDRPARRWRLWVSEASARAQRPSIASTPSCCGSVDLRSPRCAAVPRCAKG